MEENLNTLKQNEIYLCGPSGKRAGDPYLMNGLALAYIGDAVFELLVRQFMIEKGLSQAEKLHKHTTAVVNAGAQSDLILAVKDELNDRELSIFKRGRNSPTATPAKHQKISDYKRATGLEAVFGYLYLDGQTERLNELFRLMMDKVTEREAEQAVHANEAVSARPQMHHAAKCQDGAASQNQSL